MSESVEERSKEEEGMGTLQWLHKLYWVDSASY
jgi:hypothetical protein